MAVAIVPIGAPEPLQSLERSVGIYAELAKDGCNSDIGIPRPMSLRFARAHAGTSSESLTNRCPSFPPVRSTRSPHAPFRWHRASEPSSQDLCSRPFASLYIGRRGEVNWLGRSIIRRPSAIRIGFLISKNCSSCPHSCTTTPSRTPLHARAQRTISVRDSHVSCWLR